MADNFIGKDASGTNVTFDSLDIGGGVQRPRKEDPNVGLKADTVATTDTGTFSLIALFKRLLQKITAQLPGALGQTTMSASLPVTLSSDQSNVPVAGPAAAGAAVSGNPVVVGGTDGTNARRLLVDASGNLANVGAPADTSATTDTGTFSLIALTKRLVAKVTTQLPSALGQTTMSASLPVTLSSNQSDVSVGGAAAAGAAISGNPVIIGGTDGTNARRLLMDASGNQANIGAPADTAASADTGTFSLIAIAKRVVAKLTSLIALFPTALGQTTMSASFPVAIASNQSNLPAICASTTQTLTIANAATTSDAVTGAASYQSFGVIMPAAFTGTTLTFTVCDTSGGTYVDLYDRFGNQVTMTVGTSKAYDLPVELIGFPFWKIKSGSSEGGSRSLVVVGKS